MWQEGSVDHERGGESILLPRRTACFALSGSEQRKALVLSDVLRKQDRTVRLIRQPDRGHDTNYTDATAMFEFALKKMATVKP